MLPKVKILVRFDQHIAGGHVFGATRIIEVTDPSDAAEVNKALKEADPYVAHDSISVVRPETPEEAASRAAAIADDKLKFLRHRAHIKAAHEFPGKENAALRTARIEQLMACQPWFSRVLEGWRMGDGVNPSPSGPR